MNKTIHDIEAHYLTTIVCTLNDAGLEPEYTGDGQLTLHCSQEAVRAAMEAGRLIRSRVTDGRSPVGYDMFTDPEGKETVVNYDYPGDMVVLTLPNKIALEK